MIKQLPIVANEWIMTGYRMVGSGQSMLDTPVTQYSNNDSYSSTVVENGG